MGKGRVHKTYPEKERDGEIKRLKDALKRKDREIEKMKSELRTLEKAFEANIKFLKGKTAKLDLQELMSGARKEQSLKEIEVQKEVTFKEMEDRWRCRKCGTGVMKLIVYTRPDCRWYIRKCSTSTCNNRTDAQRWQDGIEGIK